MPIRPRWFKTNGKEYANVHLPVQIERKDWEFAMKLAREEGTEWQAYQRIYSYGLEQLCLSFSNVDEGESK